MSELPETDLPAASEAPAAPPSSAQDDDEPTEAYWMLVDAGRILADAHFYFGEPREMFRHPFMRARQRRIVADWVRCLEKLVRRIILMIALKLELAPRTSRTEQGAEARKPPRGPFSALRPTLTIMPSAGRRRHRASSAPDPVAQVRLHTLARRLIAINDAIVNAHLYARRTAISLAQIAERHRNAPHPLIALSPWAIPEQKLTSGQAAVYDQMERAQGLCLDQLDLWHARLLEPG
jgi:hypothetical protein